MTNAGALVSTHISQRALWLLVAAGLVGSCDGADSTAPTVARPVVTMDTGSLRGTVRNGVVSYLGIPYAAAPVRDLRWRPPDPPTSWEGVRAADGFGNDCMQHTTLDRPQSEDCLYLNVWAPANAEGQQLAVMLWIHGGGLSSGSAGIPIFDGTALARQETVVVTINYRLGRFGFFAHPALSAEDPDGLLGNYGFMDQVAALLWVQRNISAFGGNPGNVTIFGESAGGRSVHALLTSPLSEGLFHKAIIQSGSSRMRMRHLRDELSEDVPAAEALGVTFATQVGLDEPDGGALRELPALLVRGPKGETPVFPDAMIDGLLLVEDYVSTYAQGRQHPVPIIIGGNSMEAAFGDGPLTGDLALPDSLGEARDQALRLYDGYGTRSDRLIALEMEGDMGQVRGTRQYARLLAAAGSPVYLYHYSYVAQSRRETDPAARHAAELGFVFNTLATGDGVTDVDRDVARQISSYWVQFAKTGDPNGNDLPEWPPFTGETDQLLEFTMDSQPRVRRNFESSKLDFWDTLLESGWRYPLPDEQDVVMPEAAQTPLSSPQ